MTVTLRVSIGLLLIGVMVWLTLPRVDQHVRAQVIPPSKRNPTPTPRPVRRPVAVPKATPTPTPRPTPTPIPTPRPTPTPTPTPLPTPAPPQIEVVNILGDSFLMGSPESETGRYGQEGPQHRVTVPSFTIGKYEVTQAQWKAVMGDNPSQFIGDNLPVENVSWNDARVFCRKLSQITGKEYRLPTEAEWEYACRAKTTGAYAGNLDAMAWYKDNASGQTHPVGQKQPNAFGLFDMHGSVYEWCEDVWHDNFYGAPTDGSAWLSSGDFSRRALRGGSWLDTGRNCRSANRDGIAPNVRLLIGLRVVVASK